MSGTRGGIGRVLAMGIALAVALLLLITGEARAGKYSVVQCGWYVGLDADWADTTGGAKFRPDAFCVPAPPADPFDGSHAKSFTRDGQGTVSGNRFGRWRWIAPPGTGITQVSGSWWQALHDGLEQRLGTVGSGGFVPFAAAVTTDVTPRNFAVGFAEPQLAFEDRLLCARAESSWCSLDPGSWSALRALTMIIKDDVPPAAGISGPIIEPRWHVGPEAASFWGAEIGGGIRFGETSVDGARVNLTEYPCAIALISGEWRGTQMRPCPLNPAGTATIDTARFSDGRHNVRHCVTDFAGNVGCTAEITIEIDNNPPASPRSVALAGGEGWRRSNDFDLTWTDPDQGAGSPVWGAFWRITGPAGFDSGVQFLPGRDVAALADRSLPAAGAYVLHLWLRDEAANSSPATATEVPLRFDDVAPSVAFAGGGGDAVPERLAAEIGDPLSGPASGQILYRRSDSERWLELPTKLLPGAAGRASLVAPAPDFAAGTYLFRVEAGDAAGNTAVTDLRADGTRMEARVAAPVATPRAKTRLFARLGEAGRGAGDSLTVPFAAPALLSGRLTDADGAGLAGRELRVVSRPSHGALLRTTTASVRTGERGGFELRLPPAPSRRLSVVFAGDRGYRPAARPSLDLRVRSGVTLAAAPRQLANGETVIFSGRVDDRAAPIPRRGKLIAIQYLEAESGRWRPVLVTRSDHDGAFRARYRFRYVSSATTIRLRATALAEEDWPYAPGSSLPVAVRVAG
ncbi:MAG TPA: carboxypeptidase-like regulatory domain-containing protein [Solirubrobacterales bacterium]|nr:carboxypeptidase-like regulatory domain-containing protein [Solirubrobacterales bacterium]